MHKKSFIKRNVLLFKHFTRKGYALFSTLGKEVLIGTLSVSTLTYAKADGVSVKVHYANDSLTRQEVRLDEVVVTGSRAPLTSLQAAKLVSVITRDDIKNAPAESINDVLKLATGVDVRQRGGFGVQTDISINGGTFDQITILLNGIDISSPQTGHNAADFPVSLSDIERIEVLEGASARVVGSSAFSGAINIVTRCDDDNAVRLSAEAGSFGTFGGDASLSLKGDCLTNKLSGGYTQSDGGTLHSDFKKRRMYYQGGFASSLVNLKWQAGIASQDFGANTFYSSNYNDQYEATRRYIVSANADIRPLGNGKLVITPTAYWRRDLDHYQLIRGVSGAVNGENYHRTDVYGGGINVCTSWLLGTTAVGADLRREHILSTAYGDELSESEWKDIGGSDRQYDHEGWRTNTNIFLEHNILFGGFTVSAGILANKNTGLDGDFRLYPGIDISYRPSDNWKFYASWNKALRVPTFTDLYTNNAVQQGDVDLKPEKTSMFRTAATYRMKGVEATLSSFYSKGTDIIDWVYQTSESTKYKALNIGKLDNMGFSADALIKVDELFSRTLITQIRFGYAYIYQKHETEQAIYGSLYALEYLRHKATLQVDHRIWSRLSARWTVRWQQRMNGYTPYTKVDARLMWTGKSYSLHLSADNLTAHRYYDLGAVRQPGLWLMFGGNVTIGI